MGHKHITNACRRERQQRQRRQRLYPFEAETPLTELINPKYYAEFGRAMKRLRPWLPDDIPRNVRHVTRLDFDWQQDDCTPMNVCRELALFFYNAGGSVAETLGVRRVGTAWVKWKPSELFRYLSSSDHGNFQQSEKALKDLILKALGELINKS